MNAKTNSIISPTLLQSIIDEGMAKMLAHIMTTIEIEIDTAYGSRFHAIDSQFLEHSDSNIQALHKEYELLTSYWAFERQRMALRAGLLISQSLGQLSSPNLGNNSERAVNK